MRGSPELKNWERELCGAAGVGGHAQLPSAETSRCPLYQEEQVSARPVAHLERQGRLRDQAAPGAPGVGDAVNQQQDWRKAKKYTK